MILTFAVKGVLLLNCKPTITGDDKEFIVTGQLVNGHIGESSDNLLLGGKLGALLEFEVTDGSGEGKVAVNTTKVDEAAGGTNTGFFAWEEVNGGLFWGI